MHLSVTRTLSMILLTLVLVGCVPVGQFLKSLAEVSQHVNARMVEHVPPLPVHPLYVLAVSARRVGNNQLVIVDTDTWQITRRVFLLNVIPAGFSQDPQGRIWIGYGAQPGGDTRVQVFTPQGDLLKTMALCTDPILPIHFAVGRAFVPCLQNGFEAAVVVIDLTSLEVIRRVDIRPPNDSFLLLATGGDENYFAMVGNGDVAKRIILLDTHTLTTLDPLPAPDSNSMDILAYHDNFIMLNSIADSLLRNKMVEPLPEGRPDLLIVDAKPTQALTIKQMVAPGALWGTLKGDTLYAYHNAEMLGFNQDPFRAVSRLNLITDQAELWPLPDGWNARDIEVVNDEILLAYSIFHQPATAGLYRFDPLTSELALLVNIPGAHRILLPVE